MRECVFLTVIVLALCGNLLGANVDRKSIEDGWSLFDGQHVVDAFTAPTDGYLKVVNHGPGHMAIWIHHADHTSQMIELSPGDKLNTTLLAGEGIEVKDEALDGGLTSGGTMSWTPY